MRYEVTSWVDGKLDVMWKMWGRRRAQKGADDLVAEYSRRGGGGEYEVMISRAKDGERCWYHSATRAREGHPPIE
jgi:hypothetical protein